MAAAQETDRSQGAVNFTVQHVTSKDDFPGYVAVLNAAFQKWKPMNLMHPPSSTVSAEECFAFSVNQSVETWSSDPTAHYLVAKLPSGEIIGGAKWNFFQNSEPQFPWAKKHSPDSNVEMVEWYFGQLDQTRNKGMKGKKHALMATLVVSPDYQRCGIGAALLEWGLKRCDEEGLECWIDATDEGKGLYLKHGWEDAGGVEIDLKRWGDEKGGIMWVSNMLRKPRSLDSR